jgi:hypothetical protein
MFMILFQKVQFYEKSEKCRDASNVFGYNFGTNYAICMCDTSLSSYLCRLSTGILLVLIFPL